MKLFSLVIVVVLLEFVFSQYPIEKVYYRAQCIEPYFTGIYFSPNVCHNFGNNHLRFTCNTTHIIQFSCTDSKCESCSLTGSRPLLRCVTQKQMSRQDTCDNNKPQISETGFYAKIGVGCPVHVIGSTFIKTEGCVDLQQGQLDHINHLRSTKSYLELYFKNPQSVYFKWNNDKNYAEIIYFNGKQCKGEVFKKWIHHPNRCNDYFGNYKAMVSKKPFDEPN